MTRFTIKGFGRSARVVLILIVSAVLLTYGCSSMKNIPKSVPVLARTPMNRTMISSYLSVETVFKSDKQILLYPVWEKADESKGHTITWEALDKAGDKVFSSTEDNVVIHSHMAASLPIPLNEIKKAGGSSSQFALHLYIDGQPAGTKNIRYEDRSILRKDIQRIVFLPFIEYCNHPRPWGESAKSLFQNTVADAIYCEVSRIFPDSVPHYVAAQKLGRGLGMGCYNKAECLNYVREMFSDSFLIFGELFIQQVDLDASSLTVYVYNPGSGEMKKFHFFQRFNYTYESLVKDLLKGVLYEKGLIEYLGQS